MPDEPALYEQEADDEVDPKETPIDDRRLFTQPYDLGIDALLDQIKDKTLHLRPLSERPRFQRRYIWPNRLASRLIESIVLNVPIPPCYLSQNEEFELDVIDGQQRLFSIHRFLNNQFKLSSLEVLIDLNGKRFFELPRKLQLKIRTHALRCVVITNDSNPEIKFDVFERLNTNTVPLNAQELRNCIYRGSLNDLLAELAEYEPWLQILGRKHSDRRMRGEELILRFFAFQLRGLSSYRTPQKHWLNDVARDGRKFTKKKIADLRDLWKSTIDNCLVVFRPAECFRRLTIAQRPRVINRALMDLTMHWLAGRSKENVGQIRTQFKRRYMEILRQDEFSDLISKSVDHVSRTKRRFALWKKQVVDGL